MKVHGAGNIEMDEYPTLSAQYLRARQQESAAHYQGRYDIAVLFAELGAMIAPYLSYEDISRGYSANILGEPSPVAKGTETCD